MISQEAAQARIEELRQASSSGTSAEASGLDMSLPWSAYPSRQRDAIVQPAWPEIAPAIEVLRQADARFAAVPEAESA